MNTTRRIERLEQAACAAALGRFRRAHAAAKPAHLVRALGTATPTAEQAQAWLAAVPAERHAAWRPLAEALNVVWHDGADPAAVGRALAPLAPGVGLPPDVAPLAVLTVLHDRLYGNERVSACTSTGG